MAEAVDVRDGGEKPSVLIIGGLGKHCYSQPVVSDALVYINI
jgi:hypothetical protein